MKTNISIILCLLACIDSLRGQSVNLIDVVHEPDAQVNAELSADKNGGTITFNRTYRKGCVGYYNVQWSFSKNIATLRNGDEFTINLNCVDCQTPCGYRWKIANVFASNNVTKVGKFPDYLYNGNISQVNTTATSGVHDWSPVHRSHSYKFKYQAKKKAKYTSSVFNIAGHKIFYMFGQGIASAKTTNCHSLFGLGKLVYGLEIGAYEGYGWDWMDKTIGYALEHIKASGCLSSNYLASLKSRIYMVSDTKSFYSEIQAYSRKLESEVATSCAACLSCSN